MPHYRNPCVDNGAHRISHDDAAFELDGVRSGFLHEASGISDRFFPGNLVGQKWHVADDKRCRRPPGHSGRVNDHHVHRNR